MPKLKKRSQEQVCKRKRLLRDDEEYREVERQLDAEAHRIARLNEEKRSIEKQADAEARKMARLDSKKREKEKVFDLEAHKQARLDSETRKKERLADSEARKQARLDSETRKKERLANSEARKQARLEEETRKKERLADSEARKQARLEEETRKKERLADSEARKHARLEEETRKKERLADSEARKQARLEEETRKKERLADSEARKRARLDTQKREIERNDDAINRRNRRKDNEVNMAEYYKKIKLGPVYDCQSCENIFFLTSMKRLDQSIISNKFGIEFCSKVIRSTEDSHHLLCSTCHKYINQGRVPTLNFSNGFGFPSVPEVLQNLTQLEETMVSGRIPFMKITKLGVDKQYGLKGPVINILNPINETAHVLPRNFTETSVIHLKLMRKMEYENPYLFETIRPKKVYDAARYLAKTELYYEEGIVLSEEWLEKMNGDEIEFIPDDEFDSTEMLKVMKERLLTVERSHPKGLNSLNPGGQQTLLIDFDKLENNDIIRYAPGEGHKPMSLLWDLNAEELSFPSIYCGVKRNFKNSSITRTDIAKSEARHKDRRCAIAPKLLYSYKLAQTFQIAGQVQVCLRKRKGTGKPTAGNMLNNEFVSELVNHDDGYKVLKNIRSSPAYWQDKQKVLMAMIRQLGIPTLFITLSAAEVRWLELIVILKKVLDKIEITEEDADKMTWEAKADLIRRDPITCSRYFDYRLRQCNKYILLSTTGVFRDHPILDFYTRIEFQHRGSPHMHGLFWLKNAPIFDEDLPESIETCTQFIDKYISCTSGVEGVIHQHHDHTDCCKVKFKGVTKCRFGMPYPPMSSTRILLPFPTEIPTEVKQRASNDFQAVKDQLMYLNSENIEIDVTSFLDYMGLDEHQYIMAIRSSISRPTVFLKRNIKDACYNAYNATIATAWRANMDIQFILDAYACCKYVAAYVSKSCRGMSELLNKVVQEVKEGNLSMKEKLKRFSHVFLSGSEVSAQEAAYSVLSIPLSRCSRDSIYINTAPPGDRVFITKSTTQLKELPADSTDVVIEGLLDHYADRPTQLEQLTLAEFAAWWTFSKKSAKAFVEIENDDSEDDIFENEPPLANIIDDEVETKSYRLQNGKGFIRKRTKPRVIRFRNYGEYDDAENYYRENVMLYYPWREELKDVVEIDSEEVYKSFLKEIESVKTQFDRRLDLDYIEKEVANINKEETLPEYQVDDEFEVLNNPELEADFGLEIMDGGNERVEMLKIPNMLNDEDYYKLISSLNFKQKKYHDHCIANPDKKAFCEFVSGGAGVGKSMLITAISQTLMRNAAKCPGKDPTRLKVLLTASTGVAAFNIGGYTLHQAFGLPLTQTDGMKALSASRRNNLATQYHELELIVIDEVSMMSNEQLYQVSERLQQVRMSSENFGGMSILVVGDFHQLDPVMASSVFAEFRKGMAVVVSNFLWPKFRFFELTECMRQKDDVPFSEALNRLAIGACTEEDVKMFKSREIFPNKLKPPESSMRLKFRNIDVETYNSKALEVMSTESCECYANDRVQGRGRKNDHDPIRAAAKKKPLKQTRGLPLSIKFKLNAQYMMTMNVDTSDGLVNGAIGKLRKISYGQTKTGIKVPLKVWIQFSKDVGKKLKRLNKFRNVNMEWVPISKESRSIHTWPGKHLEVIRTQFPFVSAEAITIHKSQGSTFKEVVVSLQYTVINENTGKTTTKTIPRKALYVAFSRCTSLKGLFIDGEFRAPDPPDANDKVFLEMEKLRKRPVIFEDETDEECLNVTETSSHTRTTKVSSTERIVVETVDDLISEYNQDEVICEHTGIELRRRDLDTLSATAHLNDNVVDSYLIMISTRSNSRDISCWNFNSFLLQILNSVTLHTIIRNDWVAKSRTTLIFIPLCLSEHWTLFVADRRTMSVKVLDSLGNGRRFDEMANRATSFFNRLEELAASGQVWHRESNPSVPQQNNGYDCGVFLCKFADYLSRGLPITFSQEDMSSFRLEIKQNLFYGHF